MAPELRRGDPEAFVPFPGPRGWGCKDGLPYLEMQFKMSKGMLNPLGLKVPCIGRAPRKGRIGIQLILKRGEGRAQQAFQKTFFGFALKQDTPRGIPDDKGVAILVG